MEVLIRLLRHTPAPGGAGQEPQLHEVRLVNVLQRHGLLSDGGRQSLQPHGAAVVVFDDGRHHPPVHRVQPQIVDLQGAEGLVRHLLGDDAVGLHVREVPHPAEHPVGDPGRPPAAAGDLVGALRYNITVQNSGGAGDDLRQLLRGIQLQPQRYAEAVPQRGRQLPRPGGGADQGEVGQIQPDGVGRRPLAYDNIQSVVLHGGVQNFLHGTVQPVDLVHKQDVPLVEVCQQRRQIAGLFNGRAGGDTDVDPHLLSDDACQGGLAQSRRAVEQNVVQRFLPLPGGLNKDAQILLGLFLTDVLRQGLGPQRGFLGVLRQKGLGHDRLLVNIISKVDAHSFTSLCRQIHAQDTGRHHCQAYHQRNGHRPQGAAPGIPQRPHDKHRAQRRSSNARDRAYTVKQSMQIAHYFTIFFRLWRMISSNGRFSTSTPLRAICTSCVE